MTYDGLLTSKGWMRGPKCGTCTGVKKYIYVNAQRPGEEIEILYVSKLFRYKVNGNKISGGSVHNLQHQHFLQ